MPTLEEVESNGAEYSHAGIPGTIGSIDCVHVRLWNINDDTDDPIDKLPDDEIDGDLKDKPAAFDLMNTDMSGMGLGESRRYVPVQTNNDTQNHNSRNHKLITHFQQACLKGEVVWPRNNKKWHIYQVLNQLVRHL